jgi:glutaredoxin
MTASTVDGTAPSGALPPAIVFYSKRGCPWCNAIRHLLNDNGLKYEERNVRENATQLDELKRETKQEATPTLKIGNEWLVDSDAKEVAAKLGLPVPAEVKRAN